MPSLTCTVAAKEQWPGSPEASGVDGFRALDKSFHLRETQFLGDQEHLLTGW